jgi:hypothetical protein
MAGLKEGNTYRLFYKANGEEDLGVFTYRGTTDTVTYPGVKYIFKRINENGNPVVYTLNEEQLSEQFRIESSGGRRKNRRAAKKTRRNRRRSSRSRKT